MLQLPHLQQLQRQSPALRDQTDGAQRCCVKNIYRQTFPSAKISAEHRSKNTCSRTGVPGTNCSVPQSCIVCSPVSLTYACSVRDTSVSSRAKQLPTCSSSPPVCCCAGISSRISHAVSAASGSVHGTVSSFRPHGIAFCAAFPIADAAGTAAVCPRPLSQRAAM